MLVDERNKWRKEFEHTKPTFVVLDAYRQNRDSNSWRASRSIEQMCEYIMFLEDKIDEIRKSH